MKSFKPKSPISINPDYIEEINLNGLKGRIVKFPSNKKGKKRDIVLISGIHTSHERMISFAEFLRDYGDVHMIDLPGFGGMTSFREIGKKINYDSYAEYLYILLKSRKLNNNLLVFSVSVGSQFVTRMFQRYPESTQWFDRCVAFVGFGAAKDFAIKQPYKFFYTFLAYTGSTWLGSQILRLLFLNRFSLVPLMAVFSYFKSKMQNEDPERQKDMIEMEKHLWFDNDIRTHTTIVKLIFKNDMRTMSDKPIDVEFHNIATGNDQYFNIVEVRKTMRDLYTNYHEHTIQLGVHMPSMLSGKDEVAALFDEKTVKEITK